MILKVLMIWFTLPLLRPLFSLTSPGQKRLENTINAIRGHFGEPTPASKIKASQDTLSCAIPKEAFAPKQPTYYRTIILICLIPVVMCPFHRHLDHDLSQIAATESRQTLLTIEEPLSRLLADRESSRSKLGFSLVLKVLGRGCREVFGAISRRGIGSLGNNLW